MCPNHIEHYLDIHFLKSSRLSERLALWSKYSINESQFDSITKQFIDKCKNYNLINHNNNNCNEDENKIICQNPMDQVQASCIPHSIKYLYNNPVTNYDSLKDEETGLESEVDDESFERILSAIEALQILTGVGDVAEGIKKEEIKDEESNDLYLYKENKFLSIRVPYLNRSCVKPRALLLYLPQDTIKSMHEISPSELAERLILKTLNQNQTEDKKTNFPVFMTRRYLLIGKDSETDMCLRKYNSNRNKIGCGLASSRHACIYYDDTTDSYELLNYSPYGTVVDNCLYGFDLQDEKLDPDFPLIESNNSDFDDYDHENRSINNKYGPTILCDCRLRKRHRRRLGGEEKLWEGAAVLKHGSIIGIGCLNFLFVIVNYDFVMNSKYDQNFISKANSSKNSSVSVRRKKQESNNQICLKMKNSSVNSKKKEILDQFLVLNNDDDVKMKSDDNSENPMANFNINKRQLLS
jgi:hypothetical protein